MRKSKFFFQTILVFIVVSNLHCASVVLPLALKWERGKADLNYKTIKVDSFTFVYLEGGNPKGESILFVHGFGGDKDNWTRISKYFADDFHLVLVDLPGFGENDRIPNEDYSHLEQSKRLKKFVDAIGLKSFHIVGNSMGGAISGQFTLDNPTNVKSISFINAAGVKSPKPSTLTKELEQGRNPLIVESTEDFDRLMLFTMVKPPYIPNFLKNYFSERAIANAPFNKKILSDYRKINYPLEKILPKITQPSLVLWGDTDRVIDVSSVEVFQKLLKKPKIVIMKDCGHIPMIERPEETAGYLFNFFLNIK
jgi:abhydrolase domain-containing protein 6